MYRVLDIVCTFKFAVLRNRLYVEETLPSNYSPNPEFEVI